jgi:predicted MFS family arabinose efflux permease
MPTAWRLVVLLWPVALLNYLDRQVIFSLLPLLRSELSLSDTQLGLLATSFLWIYAAASLASGFVTARYGARRVILGSLGIWSAVTVLTGLSRGAGELLAARALMGMSEAFYLPAALALIAEYHGDQTRGRATAAHQSGIYLGVILGGALGGYMGQLFGWRVPFFALGGVGLAYLAVLAWGLPRNDAQPRREMGPESQAGGLARMPGFVAMTGVFAVFSMAGWVVMTWMSLYLYERFGMTLARAGFAATFFLQAGSFVGIFLGGWLSDRWSRRQPLARVYIPAVGFALSAVFLFLAGATAEAVVALAATTVYGFGRGLYDANIMPLLCLTARPEQRAPGYGIFNFSGTCSGGVTAMWAGMVKSSVGIDGAFRWCGALLLLAVALLVVPVRRGVMRSTRAQANLPA